MGEREVRTRLTCPNCRETVLSDDVFCFHCGRRLKAPLVQVPASRRFRQWPLAVAGILAFVVAGYVIHHQQQELTALTEKTATLPTHPKKGRTVLLHPVVSTTTSYPSNLPSSRHWTVEVETYQNVQLSLKLPTSLAHLLTSSGTRWTFGTSSSGDRVTLGIAQSRPADASVSLGPSTWGTPIQKTSDTASQDLYVEWSPGHWAEVLMTVPANQSGWLGAIAESVRIS